ncbi:MAG: DUF952 domain-containing protein [Nocardioides sp.]
MPRIFHIATVADWDEARRQGRYTTSTRGRTLAEEGFIHASRGDQWRAVHERLYADVSEPLVLLVIDTDGLAVPVLEEAVPGTDEIFPHVYGALDPAAVVQAVPMQTAIAGSDSFSAIFLRELFRNALLGLGFIALLALAVLAGRAVDELWGPWVGLLLGAAVGVALVRALRRRESAATR